MAINKFDIATTRRLSIGLMVSTSTFLFAAFNLIGAGISANQHIFVLNIKNCVIPLSSGLLWGFISYIFVEISAHKDVPKNGHPHSKINYLESAFVFISILGLGSLLKGVYILIDAILSYAN